jgi:hypothetical protein
MTEDSTPSRRDWRAWFAWRTGRQRLILALARNRCRLVTLGLLVSSLTGGAFLLVASCATHLPPRNIDDACALFAERGHWFADARAASQRWDVPLPVLLSIIYHESSFRGEVRPPRTRYFGFIPGPHRSSAYGYSQALDGTWSDYLAATDRRKAKRNRFSDAVDFVGWYVNETHRRNRIPKNDAYNQYLAYHEGHRGFSRGTYRQKPWLMQRARQVREQADRYQAQLYRCEPQPRAT